MLRYGNEPELRGWAEVGRTIVIVGARDETDLIRWEAELLARGIVHARFTEPDLDDQLTALAVHPSADRGLFRRLRLA